MPHEASIVASDGCVTTLQQLAVAADGIAARIITAIGVQDLERVIAIVADIGVPLLACQLAVLRTRCVFLQIDPSLPPSRCEYMLSDAQAALMLLAAPEAAALAALQSVTCSLLVELELSRPGEVGKEGVPMDAASLLPESSACRLAYVCYTSGSTGRPKGVAVSQAALLAYALANAAAHGMGAQSRVLLTSAVSFDPSIGEAWTALVVGATLCLPSRQMVRESLGSAVAIAAATHVCSTPALWATVSEGPSELTSLQCVALGGERMGDALIARWAERSGALPIAKGSPAARPTCRLHNIYGVTECTVYQSTHRMVCMQRGGGGSEGSGMAGGRVDASISACEVDDSWQAALLGEALPGCTMHLLDAEMREISPPMHATEPGRDRGGEDVARGEVAIGGSQVARGYLNRPELTAERFVHHEGIGRRVYLTGDLACWVWPPPSHCAAQQAPCLRLLGRRDQQVTCERCVQPMCVLTPAPFSCRMNCARVASR